MSALLGGKRARSAQGDWLPATIASLSPTMALIDGATTAIPVLTGHPYFPAVNDRVALTQFGSNYLALPVDSTPARESSRGVIAWNERSDTTGLAAATTTALIALTTTATLLATRRYWVYTSPILVTSTVAADVVQMRLLQSAAGGSVSAASTLVTLATASVPVANVALTSISFGISIDGPAAGVYQFGAGYLRSSGTGNVSLNIAVGRPLQLVVEDVGPALAKVA